ncbi:MAG: 4-hydroxy-tetrahydrodipicolinate synthase [Armatimonadota bacterium]|jgi:4-hydroxy-tetrahydrodipicolinate synthase
MAATCRVVTAMVTPFDKALAVDHGKAAVLAQRLVEQSSDGLLVSGSTGESPTLSPDEKIELYRTARKAVGDTAKIIAGTGSSSTADVIELNRAAEDVGVDAALVVCPAYNKPTQEGLYRHFEAVAAATALPIVVYNIPGRTGRNINADTILRLAEIDNIVAVKESSGDFDQMTQIAAQSPDGFELYSGDDWATLPALAVGAVGVVSVASHVAGPQIADMVRAFHDGDAERSKALHWRLWELFQVLFMPSSVNPAPVKAALRLAGFDSGGLRPPLLPTTPEEDDEIRRVMEEAALL